MKMIFIIFMMTTVLQACTNHSAQKDMEDHSRDEKATVYICPMHPHITSDKSGQQCSICGMNLVAIEEQGDESPVTDVTGGSMPSGRSSIKLRLDRQQLIGVKTTLVSKKNLFEMIRAPGRIAFDPDLYTAQNEYLEALRQQRKVKNSPLPEIKRSTREMVKSSAIRLQVLGLGKDEIKILAKKGKVSEGLILSGNGENLIYADVFESDLSKIKKGQAVKISASFIVGDALMGEVISVDQLIDPKTRTGKVRIKIEKTKTSIRPESFVTVEISVPLGIHIVIPLEAILDTGKDLFVFVKGENSIFEPRTIVKVFETDDFIAVLEGLDVGEEVVTSANFMIDSESRLKAVIKNMGKTSGHNH